MPTAPDGQPPVVSIAGHAAILGPDDVLVVSFPDPLATQAVDAIAGQLAEVLGEGRSLLIVGGEIAVQPAGPVVHAAHVPPPHPRPDT